MLVLMVVDAAVVVIPDVLILPHTYLLSVVWRNSLYAVFFPNALFKVFGRPENLDQRLLADMITVAADAGCYYSIKLAPPPIITLFKGFFIAR